MYRVRSQAEIELIKHAVQAEQAVLYPDYDITVSVSKVSPLQNGNPDWLITRCPKVWASH